MKSMVLGLGALVFCSAAHFSRLNATFSLLLFVNMDPISRFRVAGKGRNPLAM